ncbi:MAG: uracil-DNA glycosylase [Candidatus Gastranaerophilales bacterium]|nr:uracil-DNA glycosylase [Candidatus Gastranaerophilales bacterium]
MINGQKSLFNFSETDQNIRFKTLKEVEEVCKTCYKCDLSNSRIKVVFSDGTPEAKLMLIGEGPGKNEDETGLPFVGRAGKLLDKILLSQNITREKEIYICNIVKCRPPQNRVPVPSEREACRVYLEAQIQLIRPKLILLAGATAVKGVLGRKEPISKIRGQWFDGPFGSKIMPIFHPSYLLRYESNEPGTPKYLMYQDIQEVRRSLDAL